MGVVATVRNPIAICIGRVIMPLTEVLVIIDPIPVAVRRVFATPIICLG